MYNHTQFLYIFNSIRSISYLPNSTDKQMVKVKPSLTKHAINLENEMIILKHLWLEIKLILGDVGDEDVFWLFFSSPFAIHNSDING